MLRLGRAVAEVEVDLDTGEVAVTDVVSADEIGRVIHQVLAEGQVEGGSLRRSATRPSRSSSSSTAATRTIGWPRT